jgi:hypothetical protein
MERQTSMPEKMILTVRLEHVRRDGTRGDTYREFDLETLLRMYMPGQHLLTAIYEMERQIADAERPRETT